MILRFLTITALFLLSHLSLASNSNYVVLDLDKAGSQSRAYQNFKILWDRENSKYQKEIEFYESQINKLDSQISSQENLSQESLVKFKQQIGSHELKIQKLIQKRKTHLDSSFAEAMTQLRSAISKLVHDYVKRNKINLVIHKSQAIYVSETIDITDIIINELNRSLERIDVKF